jgi:predicted ATPase
LFEAVVELIGWASRGHPVLLVLKDLHWADVSGLELIAHVGRRIAWLPIMLILTRRQLPPGETST